MLDDYLETDNEVLIGHRFKRLIVGISGRRIETADQLVMTELLFLVTIQVFLSPYSALNGAYMRLNKTITGKSSSGVRNDDNFDSWSVTSGCFTKETLVSTSEGPLHLGRLYSSNHKPDVVSQEGRILKSDGVACGGLQEIFGLLTDSSYIKGTTDHRVLRITPDCKLEMSELTRLRKGDFVIYQNGVFGSKIPVYNGEYLDVLDAQELGKHISNMSMHNTHLSNLYFSDKFHNKSGYFSINIYNILNKFDVFVYRVPEKLLHAPKEFVVAYLKGYFDGGNRFHLNRISAAAACRELASDIIYLLSLFGIKGKITKTLMGFEIVISDMLDINLFIKEIGFLKSHDFAGSRSVSINMGIDYEELSNEYRLKSAALSQEVTALPDSITELIKNLDNYAESFIHLNLGAKLETLKLLSCTGCRATEVIEYAKYIGRDEVFNVVNVVDNHTWCANGIIVSDSS